MLQAKGDFLAFAVDVQDLDFDFVVDFDHVRWVADSAPAHIGDMKQTIDSAEVDERTEVGDIFDHTLASISFNKLLKQVPLEIFTLFFDQLTA